MSENIKLNKRIYKYNITLDEYHYMVETQNGECAICSRSLNDTKFHIDHCHQSGTVRGILCVRCNLKLGHYETNDVDLFLSYLRSPPFQLGKYRTKTGDRRGPKPVIRTPEEHEQFLQFKKDKDKLRNRAARAKKKLEKSVTTK